MGNQPVSGIDKDGGFKSESWGKFWMKVYGGHDLTKQSNGEWMFTYTDAAASTSIGTTNWSVASLLNLSNKNLRYDKGWFDGVKTGKPSKYQYIGADYTRMGCTGMLLAPVVTAGAVEVGAASFAASIEAAPIVASMAKEAAVSAYVGSQMLLNDAALTIGAIEASAKYSFVAGFAYSGVSYMFKLPNYTPEPILNPAFSIGSQSGDLFFHYLDNRPK
jgi:hypothetical protein